MSGLGLPVICYHILNSPNSSSSDGADLRCPLRLEPAGGPRPSGARASSLGIRGLGLSGGANDVVGAEVQQPGVGPRAPRRQRPRRPGRARTPSAEAFPPGQVSPPGAVPAGRGRNCPSEPERRIPRPARLAVSQSPVSSASEVPATVCTDNICETVGGSTDTCHLSVHRVVQGPNRADASSIDAKVICCRTFRTCSTWINGADLIRLVTD